MSVDDVISCQDLDWPPRHARGYGTVMQHRVRISNHSRLHLGLKTARAGYRLHATPPFKKNTKKNKVSFN